MSEGLVSVPMPQLGVSVHEGVVTSWHKAEGDAVAAGEPICDVATDKVDTEVVAPAAGTLARIIVPEGGTVAVGAPLGELAVEGAVPGDAPSGGGPDDAMAGAAFDDARVGFERDGSASRAAEAGETSSVGEPVAVPAGRFDPAAAARAVVAVPERNGRPLSSPVARRIAAEHGIDLRVVAGSGLRGRIRKADVLAKLERATSGRATTGLPRGYDDVPHEIVATSHQRRAIAEHMVRSRHTSAHMTTEVEVDMLRVSRARAEINAQRQLAADGRLSHLAFVARATCGALLDHPDLNATFDDERLIRWREVNLGVAVDVGAGLLVPVIRRAERLTAAAIGDAIADLAERARTRRLSPDDVRGGTFTITNPGSVGAVSAMAIINQPQVGILGTPAIVRRPWVVRDEAGEEAIAVRPIMNLAVTFDHRAVDGAEATRFAVAVKERLEDWGPEAYA